MKGAFEILLPLVWPLIPYSVRLAITKKIEAFRSRAAVPIPRNEVQLHFFEDSTRKLFAKRNNYSKINSDDKIVHDPDMERARTRVTDILEARRIKEQVFIMPEVSIIVTCLNEASSVSSFLKGLEVQSCKPREVIICDGGSSDGTYEVLNRWKEERLKDDCQVIIFKSAGNASIAKGRNECVKRASTDILLFTDMGAVLDIDWVKRISAPFSIDSECEVVMGWYEPITSQKWQRELSSFLLPDLLYLDIQEFFPSARSLAVKKNTFKDIGGFPEHLSHSAEDSLFDYYLKSKARRIYFVPDARVFWKMPENPFRAWNTIRRYAYGDAETGFLFWRHYFNLSDFILRAGVELIFLIFMILVLPVFFGNFIVWIFVSSILLSILYRWYLFLKENAVFYHKHIAISPWSIPPHPRLLPRLFAFHLLFSAQCFGFISGVFSRRRSSLFTSTEEPSIR
ncbi:MAG TPA: glycosyltransferase [Oligoflexia bacterium]|nr:glycosyltransferase [Oligoflexia bacterium]HMP49762.1 glycosyltransferase [Oligoflexia bacterium]